MPPSMVESVSTRKTWAVSGLVSSVRVGSTDDDVKSTTWVSFSKGRMGLTGGNGLIAWVAIYNERVGLTEDGTG